MLFGIHLEAIKKVDHSSKKRYHSDQILETGTTINYFIVPFIVSGQYCLRSQYFQLRHKNFETREAKFYDTSIKFYNS